MTENSFGKGLPEWRSVDTGWVADIISFGPDEPPRRGPRRLLAVAALLVTGAGVAAVAGLREDREPSVATSAPATAAVASDCRPVTVATSPATSGPPAGLIVDGACATGSSLLRRDRTAEVDGPWTVVVRGPGGSLGRGGAVVTFPVAAPPAGPRDKAGRAAEPGAVTWPVSGAHARVRGDLSEEQLIAIAARTTIVDRRPRVRPPAGFTVVSDGPYRSPAVHEIRYGTHDLGEQDALGHGLTFTCVTAGGGLEDQLYAVDTDRDGGLVGGRPAVVTSEFGGNAAIAWEPAPGVIAYIGYSGVQLTDESVAALRRLAGRGRLLTAGQWQERGQVTVDQTN
jgi:hypothetical protein